MTELKPVECPAGQHTENASTPTPKAGWPPSRGLQNSSIRVKKPTTALPRLAYSTQEAANMLGVSVVSLYRLIERGRLTPCRGLRQFVIPAKELDRFLKEAAR